MDLEKAKELIKEYSYKNYKKMLREPEGRIIHPFLVPGSGYLKSLWDWDCWLANIAIRQMIEDNNENDLEFIKYERGSITNFFHNKTADGRIPTDMNPKTTSFDFWGDNCHPHKPCLAQHTAFIMKETNEIEWFRPYVGDFIEFIEFYMTNCRHKETGLYFWLSDGGIGVDNDPCTYYRPEKSSASIYLNCFMYKELLASCYILELFGIEHDKYEAEAKNLKEAVREHLWDERDGFYYSADLNLLPIDLNNPIHSGAPRHWHCLIQKIGVWSGFLAMWAGIATEEQAKRMVEENLLDDKIFNSPYGVRTLSTYDKMYKIAKTGNPSCWLGPVWGISNYMVFMGLLKYGFIKEAKDLANKTIILFGQDIEKQGCMSEYYHPDTGEGVNNPGFQNWNLLSLNMIAYLDGKKQITEF